MSCQVRNASESRDDIIKSDSDNLTEGIQVPSFVFMMTGFQS